MAQRKMVGLKLSDTELTAAREVVRVEESTLSEYLRTLLKVDLRQRGLWPPALEPEKSKN